jgi:hypothetical protein
VEEEVIGAFFKIFGSKHRAAGTYPPPEHDELIEAFAGAAGYATRHHDRRVTLIEVDPKMAALWSFLIHVKPSEILAIPLLDAEQTIEDLGPVAEEARSLVGFWLNSAPVQPCTRPSAWMREGMKRARWRTTFWSAPVRARIAAQVERIRHWRVIHGSFEVAPDVAATWFIDPPYEVAGALYRSGRPDFATVAAFARSRRGLVIVCEADGATWLPFRPHATAKALRGHSREVVHVRRDGREVLPAQIDLFAR